MSTFSDDYSSIFDAIHKDKPYQQEAEFILARCQEHLGYMPKNLIDLACGSGMHAIEFVKKGLYVHANDLSAQMAEKALSRLGNSGQSEYSVSVSPMQKLPASETKHTKFDVASALYTALGYLVSPDDLNNFLNNLKTHLAPKGLFFADVWNGYKMATGFSPSRERAYKHNETSITRISHNTHRPEINSLEVAFDFQVKNTKTLESNYFKEKHLVRYFTGIELETLFKAHGFKILEMGPFFDEEKTEFFYNAWNFYIIAQLEG